MARAARYLADKLVDVLMYIAISSAIASIPYFVLPAPSPGIIFLSVAVAAVVAMTLVLVVTPHLHRKPSIEVYVRSELEQKYPVRDFLLQAKKEVNLYGLSMEKIALNQTVIHDLLKTGRIVNLIVTNPLNSELIVDIEKVYNTSNLQGVIRRTLDNFQKMKKEKGFQNLHIYTSDLFPILSVIIIDDSIVQVDSYVYEADPHKRLIALFSRTKAPEFFDTYKNAFDFVRRGATEYI